MKQNNLGNSKKMVDLSVKGQYNKFIQLSNELNTFINPSTGQMMKKFTHTLAAVLAAGLLTTGCVMPEEGTIVYDNGYPDLADAGSVGGGERNDDNSNNGNDGGSTDGGSGSSDGNGGSSDGAGDTSGTSSGDGADGSGDGSNDGTGSTGDGSGDGSSDGAGDTGGGTGVDGGDGAGTDGGDSGDGTGTGDGSGTGDGDGTGDGGDGTDNGTELDAPIVTLTPKEQKIVVSWSPVDNATSYNLTWVSSDGTENIINVSAQQVADGADPILFAHAPLVAGQNYTYTVTAVAADGTEAVGTPLTNSALPLGCTPSTYSPEGLVAYYSFEGDLSDSNGSYDFTATGDSIAYSNGCVNGLAGHFDGDGGYGYNLDFKDENVAEVADGNWSISVWVNADEDMNKFASIFSTTDVHGRNGTPEDGWGQGFQLSMTSDMRPQLFACKHCDGNQKVTAPNALELNTWTHLAVTMEDGTAKLYVNGEVVATGDGIVTEFNRLQIGINRFGQEPWKGYVDELMVFGDTLSDDDIANVYKNTLPGTPQNATATNWAGDTVVVGWDAVEGINEYNVYYSTGSTVNENSPYITVTGGTVVNFDNLTAGQSYTYAVAGVSPLGVGELSTPTTITVDYASWEAELMAVFGYTGTEGVSYYSNHWTNNDYFMTNMFVFDNDPIRVITKTDNTTTGKEFSWMNILEIEGSDPSNNNSYFGFGIENLSSQSRQNFWAPRVGHRECEDQNFTTMNDWLECVGTDFFAKADAYKANSINHGSQMKYVNEDMYLDTNGVWTLHVSGYAGWGKSYYITK